MNIFNCDLSVPMGNEKSGIFSFCLAMFQTAPALETNVSDWCGARRSVSLLDLLDKLNKLCNEIGFLNFIILNTLSRVHEI